MKKFIFYFLALNTLLLFSNCKVAKVWQVAKIYKKPSSIVVQKSFFRAEIPFTLQYGAIIIPVKIENETYDFVFDTNSDCSISPDLASKLNLQNTKKIELKHSKDLKYKDKALYFNSVPNINIGAIDFTSNVVLLKDGNWNKVYSTSGVIGANLMRNAIWQIDYKRKKIILTNFKDSLASADTKYIGFRPYLGGRPSFNTYFSPYLRVRTKISTAYYTDFSIHESIRNRFLPPTVKYVKSYRTQNMGGTDTLRHAAAPYLRFDGGWILKDNPVTFEPRIRAVMGYHFLKNYIVTLNWQDKKIGFQPIQKPVKKIECGYGFYYAYRDDKVVVVSVFENSSASAVNLQLGEQLLSIDGKDVSNITEEEFKKMVKIRNNEEETRTEVNITVKQKDGVKTFVLKKTDIDL